MLVDKHVHSGVRSYMGNNDTYYSRKNGCQWKDGEVAYNSIAKTVTRLRQKETEVTPETSETEKAAASSNQSSPEVGLLKYAFCLLYIDYGTRLLLSNNIFVTKKSYITS